MRNRVKPRGTSRNSRLALVMVCAACALILWMPSRSAGSPPPASNTLQIYFVDVEGGQATLFVTAEHASLLIDTGWPGFNGRDASRIEAAAKLAGISKIDFVLLTHYHQDHVGGVQGLAKRLPIRIRGR